MTVKYGEFSFPKSPPRPSVHGYARGGHVKPSTPMAYAKGGSTTPFRYKDGGSADVKSGVGKGGNDRTAGIGTGTKGENFKPLSDKKSPPATRKEVSSGVQKPAFAKGGHWIKGAIKHPGALHEEMGIPKGQKIPAKKLAAAAKKGGKEGKRARLAETLKGMHKSEGGSAGCYKDGGSIKVAAGAVKMGEKTSWNKDDATSPGSYKRTPPAQSKTNKQAANDKFDDEGRDQPPATKQDGNVERMAGWSDFKNGGRIKNLGKYAHGGKVTATRSETASGKAGSGKVNPSKGADAGKYESGAGTPKKAPGDRYEMKSGTAKMAMGGLSRGTSPRKNAAIHAKMSHKAPGAHGSAGLGALAGALSGMGMPHQGPQAPPGMAPGMGAPPGGQMGAIAPQAPTMGGGPPGMAHGGGVKHVIVHHISHK